LTQSGASTLTLSGANTYSGATTVNTGGTLKVANNSALGTSAAGTVVNSGATLDLNAGVNIASEALTLSGNLLGRTNGGDSEYGGAITLGAAASISTGGSGNFTVSGNVDGAGNQLTLDSLSATISVTGNITGTSTSLVKQGDAEAILSGTNNFSGGTTVDGGTLQLTVDGRIGNGGLTVNNGGTFSIANDDFNSLGGAITVNEGGTLSTDSTGNNAHNIGAITLNGGTLTSSGNTWFQGNWIFNGDVTVGGSALSTISGLAVGSQPSGGTFNVDDSVAGASTDLLVSADITLGSLTKTGAGTMELTGTGSYTGDTTVSAGTLSLASTYTHTGTGDFIVNGGTLEVADGVDISSSAMTISLGGVISPGNSPGTAITGAQTWEDGGTYLWEINDMAGGKGVDSGWDWLDIQGTLDINATFDILITSLDLSNNSGLADGFDYTGLSYLDPYASFTIATATGGVTGFDASAFNLNDSAFLNSKVGWSISLDEINNDIVLNAFFVPEPSSTALLGLGGLALMLRRKRSAA
jgi:autotransporter-associated beta strand protein